MTTRDPFARFGAVPLFTLTSTDVTAAGPLGAGQYNRRAGGGNASPQLAWSGFPPETASFTITVFDPDAAAPGFWHWILADLPASVTSLDAGAGAPDASPPAGAITLRNDAGQPGFYGAGPPPGTGVHRYQFVVHALDVPSLGIDAQATPDELMAALRGHTLARAALEALGVHGGAAPAQS